MTKRAIILAAGKGTRMKSELPKVMHNVCGVPMIEHLVEKLENIGIEEIIAVVGHKAEIIEKYFGDRVTFVRQNEQLGTAHAVEKVSGRLRGKKGQTLVLTGDTPLLTEKTLKQLIGIYQNGAEFEKGIVLTTDVDDPTGYGRIVMKNTHEVSQIIEEKDADVNQKRIKEINTGIFCFDNQTLFDLIGDIKNNNNQKEYYLTDIVGVFNKNGWSVGTYKTSNNKETIGINDKVALAKAERYLREKIRERHLENGVIMIDPGTVYIDSHVEINENVVINPNVMLKGKTVIGDNVEIGMNVEIKDSLIGEGSTITQSVIHNSNIGKNVEVGPFAHIRPESEKNVKK